jgi:hypothetical protein
MPYIPQFNKISLQEMAYAPQLMRQQHDDAIAKNMEIAEALKFDYLNQDATRLEPRLQEYSSKVDELSKGLASQGFSHDTKNKILGLRAQFTGDEEVRNIKKNYAQAMAGWEETKKGLIQKGASGQQIAQQKKSYFSPDAYKGAYDDDGFYQEFAPGMTSGIYDIAEETKKAMTNIGETGKVVGKEGTTIQRVEGTATIPAHFRVTDSRTGQLIGNFDQVEAVKRYIKAEFDPNNTTSDRGLFAKISNLDPEYINNIVDQVGGSMVSTKYGQMPGSSTNIQFDPRTSSKTGSEGRNPFQYSGGISVPSSVNALGEERLSKITDKLAIEAAKEFGLKEITSYKDLKRMAEESELTGQGGIYNPSGTRKTDTARKASSALDKINENIKNQASGTTIPAYNINVMASMSSDDINKNITRQKAVDIRVKQNIHRFTPIDDDNTKEDLKKAKDVKVLDVAPNFNPNTAGLVLNLEVTDKNDEIKQMVVILDPSENNIESQIVGDLGQLNPIFPIRYQYDKLSPKQQEDYIRGMIERYPTVSPEEQAAYNAFFEMEQNN